MRGERLMIHGGYGVKQLAASRNPIVVANSFRGQSRGFAVHALQCSASLVTAPGSGRPENWLSGKPERKEIVSMANKDQKKKSANNKPKLTTKEKKERKDRKLAAKASR